MTPLDIKILFFGTSEFAVPILEKLIENNYSIAAIITQPDKPTGRKQILTPSPVKILAQTHNLTILQPETLKEFSFNEFPNLIAKIKNLELIISASYGKIIPKYILDLPKYGSLNVHPSLLPKYRGPSPIQTAILNGDKETGVSIMLMDEKMDHGPIIAQEIISLNDEAPKFTQLHNKLSMVGANLLVNMIPKLIRREVKPISQDDAKATYTKIITREDGKINWDKSAEEIDRQIRAFNPWPGCWTIMNREKSPKRVKVINGIARIRDKEDNFLPGQVFKFESKKNFQITTGSEKMMLVKCGENYLEILKLQVEGKKIITGEDFLNAFPNTLFS